MVGRERRRGCALVRVAAARLTPAPAHRRTNRVRTPLGIMIRAAPCNVYPYRAPEVVRRLLGTIRKLHRRLHDFRRERATTIALEMVELATSIRLARKLQARMAASMPITDDPIDPPSSHARR